MSASQYKSKSQESFSSSLGFLFSAIAATVGLSNIWRFSSEVAQNGGGIYVALYIICIICVGYPLVLAELALGRANQRGFYHVYEKQGSWRWLGIACLIACFLTFCFYNVVAGWVIGYLWQLMKGSLLERDNLHAYAQLFETVKSDYVGNLIWAGIMVGSAVWIIRAGVEGGIERCAKVLMPLFMIIILGLIVYACRLDHAMHGLYYYLWPSPENMTKSSIASAVSQAFISLGIGMGILMTYGTYVQKTDNLHKSSLVIVAGDMLVALLAGLFLFAFLGYERVDFSNIKENEISGPSLAFITLPLIFSEFGGWTGALLGGSFFLLLAFAAITSSIALLDVPTRYMVSYFKMERSRAIWLTAGLSYIISILCILSESKIEGLFSVMRDPDQYNFHNALQDIVIRILTPLITFFFCLFIAFQWKIKRLFAESAQNGKPSKYFVCYISMTMKYIAPAFIGFSTLFSIYSFFVG